MLYFLFDSSLGFHLFKITNWDKISTLGAKLQQELTTFQTFKKLASLEGSFLFQGHNVAFETLLLLKEGGLPPELKDFLITSLPPIKKSSYQLSVGDKNLVTVINEQLGIRCVSGEAYIEIFRGIRTHLSDFLS